MKNTLDEFIADQMKDPEFRAEYEALEPEFAIIQAMIDARKNTGVTQKELSEKTVAGIVVELPRRTENIPSWSGAI